MEPGGYGPFKKTDKMLGERKNEQPEVMPSSPINKCKMQK
jgi:hypothetical protein